MVGWVGGCMGIGGGGGGSLGGEAVVEQVSP